VHILWWAVVGLIAGWATGQIMSGSGYGVVRNIALGIAGSLCGCYIMRMTGRAQDGGLIYSILVAIGGAVILTVIARFFIRVARV
jgi:uncharacterized membrane protein YeaQ/YmgE (transglycosylase-associated protein family)